MRDAAEGTQSPSWEAAQQEGPEVNSLHRAPSRCLLLLPCLSGLAQWPRAASSHTASNTDESRRQLGQGCRLGHLSSLLLLWFEGFQIIPTRTKEIKIRPRG